MASDDRAVNGLDLEVKAVPWGTDDDAENGHFEERYGGEAGGEGSGVLRVEGLHMGRYVVAVRPGSEYCVESIRAGSSDVLREGFIVTDG